MQFDSEEGRDNYFWKVASGKGAAPGSWIEHSITTRRGLFNDSSALRYDCARIAAHEVRFLTRRAATAEDVLATKVFQGAFSATCGRPDDSLAKAVRSFMSPQAILDAGGEENHPLIQGLQSEAAARRRQSGVLSRISADMGGRLAEVRGHDAHALHDLGEEVALAIEAELVARHGRDYGMAVDRYGKEPRFRRDDQQRW